MTTGEKITKCRKEKNLTQVQLAEALGVTRQAVSRWEGDLAFPETDTLMKMSRLFGVSCDYLLNYDEQKVVETASNEGKLIIDFKKLHFEYVSKTHIGKLPLVHVNIGLGRVAKGFFSFGLVSVGVVSFGLLSLGLITIGILCLGLLSLASISAGVISVGGIAVGFMAFGGLSLGVFSLGGCAIGAFACGGYASGSIIAIGDVAVGGIAIGDSAASGSIISVLKADYQVMKDTVYEKFEEIPAIWSVFTAWCRGLADAFMKI